MTCDHFDWFRTFLAGMFLGGGIIYWLMRTNRVKMLDDE